MDELQEGDPRQVGRYVLLGRLGSGGMGQVFLGRSPGGRQIAVKVIRPELAGDPDFRARFAREVEAARRVSGAFTAPVIAADPDAVLPWLATSYVKGLSLADAVEQHGPLPLSSVLTLAAGLAEGLHAVHEAGIIHRDLKPSNVLLAEDGPRLIDFGISQAADSAQLTLTGMVIGTPGFMSPEQALGEPLAPASDIFSLGAVLVFAATGEGPYGAGSPAVRQQRQLYSSPGLRRLPAGLRPLVERCMARDPAGRPTASEFLASVTAAHPTAADQAGWLPPGILPGNGPPPGNGPVPGMAVSADETSAAAGWGHLATTSTTARADPPTPRSAGSGSGSADPEPVPADARPGSRRRRAWLIAAAAAAVAVVGTVIGLVAATPGPVTTLRSAPPVPRPTRLTGDRKPKPVTPSRSVAPSRSVTSSPSPRPRAAPASPSRPGVTPVLPSASALSAPSTPAVSSTPPAVRLSCSLSTTSPHPGTTITMTYHMVLSRADTVGLGAAIYDDSGNDQSTGTGDIDRIYLPQGQVTKSRPVPIPGSLPPGTYEIDAEIWPPNEVGQNGANTIADATCAYFSVLKSS